MFVIAIAIFNNLIAVLNKHAVQYNNEKMSMCLPFPIFDWTVTNKLSLKILRL